MKPRLLYFTRGSIDSKKAFEIVNQYPDYSVTFRDTRKPQPKEDCAAVAGDVPTEYASCVEASVEVVNAFELPVMTAAVNRFIKKHHISDEELSKIEPTGMYGLIKSDVEKYIAESLQVK